MLIHTQAFLLQLQLLLLKLVLFFDLILGKFPLFLNQLFPGVLDQYRFYCFLCFYFLCSFYFFEIHFLLFFLYLLFHFLLLFFVIFYRY